ncbi:MAG TPA: hypothetical protein VF881_19760 [Polyangiaceae bacterium]
MATGNTRKVPEDLSNDQRRSGIPRSGHLGAATREFTLVLAAIVVLVLLGLAFYYASR